MHQLLDSKISIFVQDFSPRPRRASPASPEQPTGCEDRRRKSDAEIGRKADGRLGKKRRANGGCLGYPEARKDVVSCEKPRGSANRN